LARCIKLRGATGSMRPVAMPLKMARDCDREGGRGRWRLCIEARHRGSGVCS
jgi:hypothetical protein